MKPYYKNYKAKAEERKGRFGFQYIRDNINYKTQIPELPDKPRNKPDEKAKQKKIQELNEKTRLLKEKRKQKKDKIKKLDADYDIRSKDTKNNISLGNKCLDVLHSDSSKIQFKISKISNLIRKNQDNISNLYEQLNELKNINRPQRRANKTYQQMNNRQLDWEKKKIQDKMTRENLTKKEEAQLNSILTKIDRIKADKSRNVAEDTSKVNTAEIKKIQGQIQKLRNDIQKLRAQKNGYFDQLDEIKWKKECIQDDIDKFIADIERGAENEDNNPQRKQLYQDSSAFKEQIYKIRDEIAAIENQFDQKVKQYEYEQQKIEWINWATKVQIQKRQEWQAQKLQRKRQKQKQKQKGGDKKQAQKKQGDANTENKEPKKEERKKFNKNQKQIDNVSFLIDYCKRLYPSNKQSSQISEKKEVNLNEELKKGAWAKQKGIQVIQSKKKKDEDENVKVSKYQKRKEEQKEDEQASNGFSHDYFVQRFFQNAKVVPPSNTEQVHKAIKELQDKLEYYLSHPDEGVDSKFEQDRKFIDKNLKSNDNKNFKNKGNNSKVINTEDFPSLP